MTKKTLSFISFKILIAYIDLQVKVKEEIL